MELAYAYRTPSRLSTAQENPRVELAASGGSSVGRTTTGSVFYSGFLGHPLVVAQPPLLLARVTRTDDHAPPNMVAALLRAAAPVVTAAAEGLRFESFSACCGVYARLDVEADSLETEHHAVGVTNVDVNPPFRQVLVGLGPAEPLHLRTGAGGMTAALLDGKVVEEKVPLPRRWLKGFAEAQTIMAEMDLHHELKGPAPPSRSSPGSVPWTPPATARSRTPVTRCSGSGRCRSIRGGGRPRPLNCSPWGWRGRMQHCGPSPQSCTRRRSRKGSAPTRLPRVWPDAPRPWSSPGGRAASPTPRPSLLGW